MRNFLEGLAWISVYLTLVLAPLLVLLFAAPAGIGFWWDFSIALGFAGLAMMGVQFVLTARFRRATAPYGIDIIYFFHRYLAVLALLFVIAHAWILIIENPFFLDAFNPFAAPIHLFAGVLSAAALGVLVASSLWRKQIRLHYDAWRILHVILAVVAIGFAVVHVQGVGYYIGTPWKKGSWMMIVGTWIAIGVWVRLIKPWRLLWRPYRVTAVTPERGSAWTVAMEPVAHDGFSFEPGQFSWLTLRHSPFAMKEHPFSMSSPPRADGKLEFTIKELGDFTSTIGQIESGETAYVDGPYGAFSIDRYRAPGFVFIGGGIGLAPLMSMMRALAERGDRRPHLLFTANSRWERIPFREAMQELETRLDLSVVHVLEEPPEVWGGETGFLTREILERHLPPDRRDREYFVCGPRPMIEAVERELYQLGVPMRRAHSEIFDLV